jgi:hypothetical protein
VALPDKKNFHLFLLAGQSNMAGRGTIDETDNQPIANLYSLNRQEEWQPAVDPLHWDKKEAGVGIGRTFAGLILARNPGITVGLIPSACGGSPISTWAPGKFHDQTNSKPYDDAIARARRAMQDGTLKAILWHQGEGDCSEQLSLVYEDRLEEVITNLRKELGTPGLPFIMGQIGRFPAKPWPPGAERVDQAQRNLARKMKNVFYISAEGLESRGDNLHFDTPSLRILAKGYADAYLQIANP